MENNPDKQYAVIYARVSSDRQRIEGNGLDSQEHRCREYALANNYIVDKVFMDAFTGGGDFLNRPAMKALLSYLDSKPHRKYVVVFDDLKRFARDTVFHWNLRDSLRKREATPKCLNYNFDDSPEGRFAETIFAAQNQLEREQNRRQVIQKQKAVLESGRLPFGGFKIGYDRVKDPVTRKKVMVPGKHAPILKEALEGFAYKRFPKQIHVARFLKENGVFGGQHAEKYLKMVRLLLEDIFYAGQIEYLPWEVSRRKGIHEGLISLEVYELNQKRLSAETIGKRFRHTHNPDFSLCGLANCAQCKKPFRAYWGKGGKYPYYGCQTNGCPNKHKTIKRADIEGDFNGMLQGYTPKPGLISVAKAIFEDAWKKEYGDVALRFKKLAVQKESLGDEVAQLADKIAKAPTGSVLEEELSKRLEEKAQDIRRIDEQIQNSPSPRIPYLTAAEKVLEAIKSPLQLWTSADINQKQTLFFFFFDERLLYEREKGYLTAQVSPILRLFEHIDNPSSLDVEVGRIELPSEPVYESESTTHSSD